MKKFLVCAVCVIMMPVFTGAIEWVVGKFLDSTWSYITSNSYNITVKVESSDTDEQQYNITLNSISRNVSDDSNALTNYLNAASKGDADAQFILGSMYYNGDGVTQDFSQAFKWFSESAAQGNAKAQNSLGLMYYNGEGVEQSYSQAVKWFTQAAEQGNQDSQFILGDMYYNGEGIAQDYTQAVKWFKKAADQGNQDAKDALKSLNEL